MIRRTALLLLLVPVLNTAYCADEDKPKYVPTTHMVEMRDGTKLATDVYLPKEGNGPWPVLMERTPYKKENLAGHAPLTEQGIAFVVQDVRGRHSSDGRARPFADDAWGKNKDGYDTVEWVRAQKWSDGKIATTGGSAGGITQIMLATTGPEGIVGQYVVVAPVSNYSGVFYQGGCFRKSLAAGWLKAAQWPPDNLPEIRYYGTYSDYWAVQNLGERVENVDWPVVLVAGWYDIFQQGSIDAFTQIQQRASQTGRDNVHLIMGPWPHGIGMTKYGEVEFPESGKVPDDYPKMHDWVAQWLLGKPLPKRPAPVTYYTMGELPGDDAPGNEWRSADTWPVPATFANLYLAEREKLDLDVPRASTRTYNYDPNDPVPSLGGPNLLIPTGPFDQRPIESRKDVLLFTTPPLKRPMEVTGRMTAVLYVSTTAKDTDFTAKLTDVYPDGRSMLITDGIQRLSLRLSQSDPTYAESGKVYCVTVDLWSTSYIFNKGHRIRLAVSSSNEPRFEANPNTGHDWTSGEKVVAGQTVHLGGKRASHMTLPVVGEAGF